MYIKSLIGGGYGKLRHTVDQTTQHLVALAKDGDESALAQLCSVYGERVRRIVRLRMGSEIRSKLDSMDLVQDALVSVLEDLGDFTYRNEGDFLRWLSKIAENRIRDNLDRLHADRRDIRKEVRLDDYGRTAGGVSVGTRGPINAATPSVIISRKEELDKLEKAIDKLRPEYREVIVLKKIEGLSYKEIGDRLGKSTDAVGMLVSRAMVALIRAFEKI
ncbi:MAG: sigma-70 family RNA polymerase sigma factor [Phycisphaerales bacterium]